MFKSLLSSTQRDRTIPIKTAKNSIPPLANMFFIPKSTHQFHKQTNCGYMWADLPAMWSNGPKSVYNQSVYNIWV